MFIILDSIKFKVALIILIIIFGLSLAFVSNYGPDNDTYAMISTFNLLVNGGGYTPSRFTGYPVAEVFIGFLSFHFGSWLLNSLSLLFIIFSTVLITKLFISPLPMKQRLNFTLIVISNPVIFFDNLMPMDYSLAILFLSLGMYFYAGNRIILSLVCFSLSAGTRPISLLFVLVFILLYNSKQNKTKLEVFEYLSGVVFFSALFYVPVWFQNSLTLDWVTSARPLNQGLIGLFARFIYKSYYAFGFLSAPVIAYIFFRYVKVLRAVPNFKLIISIIVLNLFVFLYIPAERSYLQLGIVFTLLLISFIQNRILNLIFLGNLISWLLIFQPFQFEMRYPGKCSTVEAVGMQLRPTITPGEFFIFREGQRKFDCFNESIDNQNFKFQTGGKLK